MATFSSRVLIIIVFNCSLGWAISKLGILPRTTAIWGLLPGAASTMTLMAEGYGADARLVAFMQYLRVVLVAILASVIARFWVHATATAAPAVCPDGCWRRAIYTLAPGCCQQDDPFRNVHFVAINWSDLEIMTERMKAKAHWARFADEWIAWARSPGGDAFWMYRRGFLCPTR